MLLFGLVITLAGFTGVNSRASDKEIRHFSVAVDGKAAGKYKMTINQDEDGTLTMTGDADIKVSYLLASYKYRYQGTEVWKDGRLQKLTSKTNDDGKKYDLSAWADASDLRIQVNGVDRTTRWDLWTSSYWRLPEERFRNRQLFLLDCDTGKETDATLKFVASQSLRLAGQIIPCTHYRIRGGGLQVELWFDAQERLVREEAIEDGHKEIIELSSIER
jgi:hypothetical protein